MPALDVKVKRFIVIRLAHWDTPTQCAQAVKEEFGIEVSRQQVSTYDPTKVNGRELSKELKALFEETRARVKAEIDAIPIANQSFRLALLNAAALKGQSVGNLDMVLRACESAAKEVGGAYTNRREHSGPGGAPIPVSGKVEHMHALSDEQLDRIIRGDFSGLGG